MRRIRTDVGKEGPVRCRRTTDERVRLLKEHVRAEPLRRLDLAIVEITPIEIGIVPYIRRLANSTTSMTIDLFKATIFRPVRVVVAQVPFAKHARRVTRFLEQCS